MKSQAMVLEFSYSVFRPKRAGLVEVTGVGRITYCSRFEAIFPVHKEENCVSITERKNRKNPLCTLMLATPPDFTVNTRIATTNTSSMDHLPMCETNLRKDLACSAVRPGYSQSASRAVIFTIGKQTVKTKRMRNKKISLSLNSETRPCNTDTWFSKIHSLVTEVKGRNMPHSRNPKPANSISTIIHPELL